MSTLIIFDWDDTLLPTTCLEKGGDRVALDTISTSVIRVLTEAQKYGTVMIITIAEKGWVEESCHRYMPRCAPILAHIVVFSARTTYEWMFDSPYTWKILAFQIASVNFSQVLSIGDTNAERNAVLQLDHVIRAKSIQLKAFPTADTILEQLDGLAARFRKIITHEGDLDIRFKDLKTSSK